jgi:Fur family zinc uptake transcriptional regulator
VDSIFPHPGHDHARCTGDALAHAELLCTERGERLTPMRRQVLQTLAGSHQPLGAYEIIERLGVTGPRPAPITIYRALEFLLANGLAHRIESLNAFINNHASGSPVVFLICERCGAVGEAPSSAVGAALLSASQQAAFTPKTPVIEITGICGHCSS